jgi:hypothetical protein
VHFSLRNDATALRLKFFSFTNSQGSRSGNPGLEAVARWGIDLQAQFAFMHAFNKELKDSGGIVWFKLIGKSCCFEEEN